jgi:hypothetical protein
MTRLKHALVASLAILVSSTAVAAPQSHHAPRVDLADTAAGSYYGSVISDSRGSGQSDVTITVTKTAPNTISVSSSYARLPTFTVKLTRAMQTIQQATGSTVFLLDLAKTPRRLDITVDGASWSGDKQ